MTGHNSRKARILWRKVWEPRNTILGIGAWAWPHVNTAHWWMDAWHKDAWRYLHAPLKDGPDFDADERVTRAYPRQKRGHSVRLGFKDGALYWLYDRDESGTE